MSANDIANCPWNYIVCGTEEDSPFMTAAFRELNEKFKPGVAYRRIEEAPFVAYTMVDEMVDMVHSIHLRAWDHLLKKLPGWTVEDITNLYADPMSATAGDAHRPRYHATINKELASGQSLSHWLTTLCRHTLGFSALFVLEKLVNRKAKELEQAATTAAALELATKRIADLEESLAAMNQRQLAMASAIILTGNLEKRLQASEELNAKLMDRLATLEKLLL